MYKLGLKEAEEPDVKLPHSLAHGESKGVPEKNICFIEYAKAFEFVDHNKLWKILKELGVLQHFSCLLRNLHVSQKAILRSVHATIDWFKIYKGE